METWDLSTHPLSNLTSVHMLIKIICLIKDQDSISPHVSLEEIDGGYLLDYYCYPKDFSTLQGFDPLDTGSWFLLMFSFGVYSWRLYPWLRSSHLLQGPQKIKCSRYFRNSSGVRAFYMTVCRTAIQAGSFSSVFAVSLLISKQTN